MEEQATPVEVQQNIYSLLPLIAAEIGYVPKSGWNPKQQFAFRTLDATVEAFHKAVTKFGVTCVPRVTSVEHVKDDKTQRAYVTVEYAFFASDGSAVVTTVVGEGADSYDKATSKALSMAFKYMLFQTFSIPTGEPDPDGESAPAMAPARPSNLVSEDSVAHIRRLLDELGIVDVQERRETVAAYSKRPDLPNLLALTDAEAQRVIEMLIEDLDEWNNVMDGSKKSDTPAVKRPAVAGQAPTVIGKDIAPLIAATEAQEGKK